jgi:hypothetical protein
MTTHGVWIDNWIYWTLTNNSVVPNSRTRFITMSHTKSYFTFISHWFVTNPSNALFDSYHYQLVSVLHLAHGSKCPHILYWPESQLNCCRPLASGLSRDLQPRFMFSPWHVHVLVIGPSFRGREKSIRISNRTVLLRLPGFWRPAI